MAPDGSSFRAFTIVGRNYLAHARVLAESFNRMNPDATFDVFLLDGDGSLDVDTEPFGVLVPSDVFGEREFNELVAIYSVMELATAVKPRVLTYLLDHSDGPALYLDPDLWIFESLDQVASLASDHGIVLTPHAVSPFHRDGRRPAETEILKSGVYNLGFLAVGQSARPFLSWWWDRLERDCIVAPEDGLFVDQRWVDFAPGLFDHYIFRDPGYNVAYWNLGERELKWSDGVYTVDGQPLVFAHFSGFDPERPYVLSKHTQPNPRVLLSEMPALGRICGEYADAMLEAGYVKAHALAFGLDRLPNGIPLDRTMRRVYREALVDYEENVESSDRPPNPFGVPGAFMSWLAEPAGGEVSRKVTRYLAGLWSLRLDLQAAFGDLQGDGATAYLSWVMDYGRIEESIPTQVLSTPDDMDLVTAQDAQRDRIPGRGVNVAGYLRAELGVGEAARTMGETVVAAGEELALLAYSGTRSREDHPIGDVLEAGLDIPPYDVNIVTINADSTVQFAIDVGSSFYDRRYTIGMWAWEVEEFPVAWLPAFDSVDEVWMNSAYAAESVRKVATKPVTTFPLTVSVPPSDPAPKSEFGLPDQFMFLFSFDFFSIFERKNPLAVIDAFSEAFAPGEGPMLVIKSINGAESLSDLERLRMAAADRDDIYVMDGYLPVDLKNRLVATADAYVSLHRSEGFGLTMAEAMALGKPTIATGYSGNLEFMDATNSYLVDYELTTVPEGCDPYPVGAAWAEPDTSHAAVLMRQVYDNQEQARTIGLAAEAAMARDHSPAVRAELLTQHLARIRAQKSDWANRTSRVTGGGTGSVGLPILLEMTRDAVDRPIQNRWVDDGSGGVRGKARDAALAALRPAIARGRAIDENLLESVALLWAHVQDLQASLLQASVERGRLDTRSEALHGVVDRVDVQIEQVRSGLAAVSAGAVDFRTDATTHLARLSEQLGRLEEALDKTDAALHAPPYMADPEVFALPESGMGFTGGGGNNPYRDFEDIFRGDEAFIRDRQRTYLALLGDGPVLDAGSGRGEFLDLLADAGFQAVGVDLDDGMVRRCQAKGHSVVLGDVVDYLRDVPDGHYGSVFSAQFIEHVPLDRLIEFMELSVRKLRPGGVFIAETVNPHSLPAFRTFWTDLTHRAPIYPEVALSLLRSSGFDSGSVIFPNGVGDLSRDLREAGEYAVVGRNHD